MSKGLIVAIDGPAGSGKSTSAKLVAQKLGYTYIDTGAMYRAVTYIALKEGVIDDIKAIIALAKKIDIKLKFEDSETVVMVDGENISDKIRSLEVNSKVSDVSKIKEVRSELVRKQRRMGEAGGVVMEGRDITTVVFSDADVKIYLTASIEQRTERRAKEYAEKGIPVSIDHIKNNLLERDQIDSTRHVSPLSKAADAVEVDTSKVTIEEQVQIIIENVIRTAEKKGIKLNL